MGTFLQKRITWTYTSVIAQHEYVVVTVLDGTLDRGGDEETRHSVEIKSSVTFHSIHVHVFLLHDRCVHDQEPHDGLERKQDMFFTLIGRQGQPQLLRRSISFFTYSSLLATETHLFINPGGDVHFLRRTLRSRHAIKSSAHFSGWTKSALFSPFHSVQWWQSLLASIAWMGGNNSLCLSDGLDLVESASFHHCMLPIAFDFIHTANRAVHSTSFSVTSLSSSISILFCLWELSNPVCSLDEGNANNFVHTKEQW